MSTKHEIEIGAKVKVRFQAGWFNRRFYKAGWRTATVTGHSLIGEARVAGGFPTYDVALRDGNTITHCSAGCVRRAGKAAA